MILLTLNTMRPSGGADDAAYLKEGQLSLEVLPWMSHMQGRSALLDHGYQVKLCDERSRLPQTYRLKLARDVFQDLQLLRP